MKRGVLPLALITLVAGAVAAAAMLGAAAPRGATASSHREAPMISDDPAADNTDSYAFVSPDANFTPSNAIDDDVDANEQAYPGQFPYVAAPNQGYAHTGHN